MEFQSKISFLNKDTSNGNCNASTKLLFMDVHKNKWNWLTKRKEIRLIRFHGIDSIELSLTSHSKRDPKKISTYSSMPNLINKYYEKVKLKSNSSLTHMWKHSNRFRAQLIESDHRLKPQSNTYNGRQLVKLCVYQCQFRPGQECRCCSCNSDSMFEVMKSLYDCYKKKNCDYCKCILCGHLPVQERKIAESRQSFSSIGQVISIKVKKQKPKKIVRCKSPAEKEEFLNEVALSDASLPEGKTSCDKGVICGFTVPVSSIRNVISSDKIRTAGLITPLAGKTLEEKEKILRGLAMSGITLPEGKTASEKKLIDKMRIELGLPPEPRTSAAREKYKKAAASGLLIPLEGKSAAQKKKMLRAQANLGIALPKGRTASEKILIEKIKIENGKQPQSKNSFEKLPKAKEAGLLTPLTEKTPEQKEKILRGQAAAGLPLPDGKTASEKALIEKIKREVGINPTPLSSEAKKLDEQTAKVMKGGKRPFISCILTPESGKFSAKTPSEKFRKAKEAGLLTPLEEKSQEHKEKILRGLVKQGIPLPEGKTASKKKLTDKIRHDMGLPPEPKTSPSKERYTRAQALGLITPLEGKSATHKEKILRVQAAVGLPLPEGRTPSEKALIQKVKKEVNKLSATRIRLEKFRKAKEAGLLSPLTGKTPVQKEKILREMAARGIPVPEGKTASEKKLLEIVRRDMGLPPEPKTSSMKAKYNKAVANGIIVPLEGKTIHEKEKILKAIKEAGIPLPEGRTASDKFLIRKIQASSVAAAGVPSAKIRATKGSLLIPLTGKTTQQKVKVVRSLAERDIFLAEPRTASEKKNMGNTKVKEIPSKRTPLSEEAKELDKQTANINRDGAAYKWIYGILTTESHTFSLEAKPSKISSEKLRKQKSTSFLTPLDGKSAAEKEKIVKGLAEAGLPLPKGKTASEKVLLQKIKAEYGIPPDAKTASEKEIVRKAKAEGLLTPLKGKSRAEKEKNLKGLAQAGLPMPEGITASEKALIKSIRRTTGLPPTPTPSEKLGEIKTKSKRVGEGLFSIRTIARAVGDKCEAGIVENFQGEAKTTTCDRRCGCDKKKIKFKHSYVKIKVTCPKECVPMCADDEGIKITVGSAIGFPSFILSVHALKLKDKNLRKEKHSNSSEDSSYATDDDSTNIKLKEQMHKPNDHSTHKVKSVEKLDEQSHRKEHFIYEYMIDTLRNYEKLEDSSKVSKNLVTTFSSDKIGLLNSPDTLYNSDSGSGLDSLILLMTESSLSFSSSSNSSIITNAATINVKSRNSENVSPTSSHNICIEESACSTIFSERKDDEGYFTSDFKSNCNNTRQSKLNEINDYSSIALIPTCDEPHKLHEDEHVVIFNLPQVDLRNKKKDMKKASNHKHYMPIVIIRELKDSRDIMQIVKEVLSKENIAQTSSIIVVAPASTEEYFSDIQTDGPSNTPSSTICIRMPKHYFKISKNILQENVKDRRSSLPIASGNEIHGQGIKFTSLGGHYVIDSAIPKSTIPEQSFKTVETLYKRERKRIQESMTTEIETLLPPRSLPSPRSSPSPPSPRSSPSPPSPRLSPSPPSPRSSPSPPSPRLSPSPPSPRSSPTLPSPTTSPKPPSWESPSNRLRQEFSMDTSQDRPCCCVAKSSTKNYKVHEKIFLKKLFKLGK